MHARKGRRVLYTTSAVAVLVLIGFGVAVQRFILESLDLSRLDSENAEEAREAAMRLARSRSRRAIPRLVLLLKDESQKRPWVSDALRELGPVALRALGKELEDGLDEGDAKVTRFLESLGPGATETIPSFVKCLELVEDDEDRFEVAYSMLEIDPEAYSTVRPLLQSASRYGRLGAIECLRLAHEKARPYLPELIALFEDPDPEVRAAAFGCLVALRVEADTARSLLLDKLRDGDPRACFAAARALTDLGGADEEVVPVLIDALQSHEVYTPERAADSLGKLGAKARSALPALVECLKDASTLAGAARRALLQIDPHAAAPLAAQLLQHQDVEVRKNAVMALGPLSLHNTAYICVLVRTAAHDPDEEIISYANGALRDLGPAARDAVPALVELLKEPHPQQQSLVVYALGGIGEAASEAVPALRELVRSGSADIRQEARWALEEISPVAADLSSSEAAPSQEEVEGLFSKARRGDLDARRAVTWALAELKTKAADIIPVLVESLKDPQPEIRAAVLGALAELRVSALSHLTQIAGALSDDAEDVRSAAVELLSHVESVPGELLWTLSTLLSAPRKESREAAARVFEGLRTSDARVIQELAARLADEDRDVRLSAVSALLAAGTAASSAAPALEKALDDADLRVRLKAAVALWSLDPKPEGAKKMMNEALEEKDGGTLVAWFLSRTGKPAASLFQKAFQDKYPGVRIDVAEALAELGTSASWAVPELTRAVTDENSLVRSRAILALAAIGPAAKEAGPAIAHVAEKDENAYNRVWAGYALGRIGVSIDVALRALSRGLKEGNRELREQAASFLGNFGEEAHPAVPALEKALRDPEGSVRKAAARALRSVEKQADPRVGK